MLLPKDLVAATVVRFVVEMVFVVAAAGDVSVVAVDERCVFVGDVDAVVESVAAAAAAVAIVAADLVVADDAAHQPYWQQNRDLLLANKYYHSA